MLSLDDSRWADLHAGYRVPYDARSALRRLATRWTDRAAWEELWGELHHQGDVGEASYAALTVLADLARSAPSRGWDVYGLTATIETQRHAQGNPALPDWLAAEYGQAWTTLAALALRDLQVTTDPYVVRSALAVVALARGEVKLGALLGGIDDSDLDEYVEERLAWSERYRRDVRSLAEL